MPVVRVLKIHRNFPSEKYILLDSGCRISGGNSLYIAHNEWSAEI
jgi:hypothetical protein